MCDSIAHPHPRNYFRLACVFYFSLLEKQKRESKEKTEGLEGHNAQKRLDSRLTRICLPEHPSVPHSSFNPALPPRIWGSQYSNRVELPYFTKKKVRGHLKLGLPQFQVLFNLCTWLLCRSLAFPTSLLMKPCRSVP